VEKVPKVSVWLVNDLSGHDVPLMRLIVDNTHVLGANINQFGEQVSIKINVTAFMSLSYYNMKLADWEPTIEHHGLQVKYARKPNTNPKSPVPFMDKIQISDIRYDDEYIFMLTL
jgi:hypothetical protein